MSYFTTNSEFQVENEQIADNGMWIDEEFLAYTSAYRARREADHERVATFALSLTASKFKVSDV